MKHSTLLTGLLVLIVAAAVSGCSGSSYGSYRVGTSSSYYGGYYDRSPYYGSSRYDNRDNAYRRAYVHNNRSGHIGRPGRR